MSRAVLFSLEESVFCFMPLIVCTNRGLSRRAIRPSRSIRRPSQLPERFSSDGTGVVFDPPAQLDVIAHAAAFVFVTPLRRIPNNPPAGSAFGYERRLRRPLRYPPPLTRNTERIRRKRRSGSWRVGFHPPSVSHKANPSTAAPLFARRRRFGAIRRAGRLGDIRAGLCDAIPLATVRLPATLCLMRRAIRRVFPLVPARRSLPYRNLPLSRSRADRSGGRARARNAAARSVHDLARAATVRARVLVFTAARRARLHGPVAAVGFLRRTRHAAAGSVHFLPVRAPGRARVLVFTAARRARLHGPVAAVGFLRRTRHAAAGGVHFLARGAA